MHVPIARIILYVKDMPKVAEFYRRHFGFVAIPSDRDDWLEMRGEGAGCTIALHQASVAQKSGAAMKIVFAVKDVRKFKAERAHAGLKFGSIHEADEFEYANAKDPAGNSISISSRGLK